jgi:PAS domain S-box-containing protein
VIPQTENAGRKRDAADPERSPEKRSQPPTVTASEAAIRFLQRNLSALLLLLAVFQLALAIDYALFLPTAAAGVLSKLGLSWAGLFIALSLLAYRFSFSGRLSEIVMFGAGLLTLTSLVGPLRFHPEPKHTLQAALGVFGFGLIGLRAWLLGALSGFAVTSWFGLAYPHLSMHWIPDAAILALAVVFSLTIQPYRLRSLQQAENLRLENDWQREQLASAYTALQMSEERFRRLSEAAFEAIAIHHSGEILAVNHAFGVMFGCNPEGVQGNPIRRYILCSEPQVLETLFRGTSGTVSAMGIHSDGTMFPVEIRVKPIPYGGRPARVVAIRDVSERVRTEEALRRAKEEAERANEAKGKWLASVSHELRTPLNSIIGFSEMLADQFFGPLNEKQQRYVSNILTSGRHLLQMINDLLDLSKIEAGRMQLEISEFDPRTAVKSTVESLAPLAFQKRIQLETKFRNCPPAIQADPVKFRQILSNLLSNAIKFTGEGGKVTVWIDTEERAQNAYFQGTLLKISVQDTGVGIPPDQLRRIFEEFEQLPNRYQAVHKGTGLGLSLAEKLVKLHGGTIWAESEGEGKGSTFHFVIPVRQGTEVSPHPAPRQQPAWARPSRKRHAAGPPLILIVDDDPESRELLHDALNAAGYRVVVAQSAAEAERLCVQQSPDVVLLDILFDRQEKGWHLLSALKGRPETADTPVVVVSVVDNRNLSLKLGAVEHFTKPVKVEELMRTLAHLTAGRAGAEQRILLAHPDTGLAEALADALARAGFSVIKARDGMHALQLAQTILPEVMVLGATLPKVSGCQLVRYLKRYPHTRGIQLFLLTEGPLPAPEEQELSRLATIVRPGEASSQDESSRSASLASYLVRHLRRDMVANPPR